MTKELYPIDHCKMYLTVTSFCLSVHNCTIPMKNVAFIRKCKKRVYKYINLTYKPRSMQTRHKPILTCLLILLILIISLFFYLL